MAVKKSRRIKKRSTKDVFARAIERQKIYGSGKTPTSKTILDMPLSLREVPVVKTTNKYKYMEYNKYLKSGCWKKQRKQALRKADNKCQTCNTSLIELHVHHRTYSNKGTDKESGDLIVLCRTCHRLIHSNKKIH